MKRVALPHKTHLDSASSELAQVTPTSPDHLNGGSDSLNAIAYRKQTMHEALGEELIVYENLGQEVVITTVDKLKHKIRDYEKALNAKKDWVAPASILISLSATLLSADFKNTFGISPETWQALFLIGIVFSGIWLVLTLINLVQNTEKGGVDALIESIKGAK